MWSSISTGPTPADSVICRWRPPRGTLGPRPPGGLGGAPGPRAGATSARPGSWEEAGSLGEGEGPAAQPVHPSALAALRRASRPAATWTPPAECTACLLLYESGRIPFTLSMDNGRSFPRSGTWLSGEPDGDGRMVGEEDTGPHLPGPVPPQGLSRAIIWLNQSLWRPALGVGSQAPFSTHWHPRGDSSPEWRRTRGVGSGQGREELKPGGKDQGPSSQPLTFPTTRAPWPPRDCLGRSPQLKEPRPPPRTPWAPGLLSAPHLPYPRPVHPSKVSDSAEKSQLVNETCWQYYGTPGNAGQPHLTWNTSALPSDTVTIELWGYEETGEAGSGPSAGRGRAP